MQEVYLELAEEEDAENHDGNEQGHKFSPGGFLQMAMRIEEDQ